MFTGLIQGMGEVVDFQPTAAGASLAVRVAGWPAEGPPLSLGESIAVSGCCLTLARLERPAAGLADGDARLGFDLIHQTLGLTWFRRLRLGDRVNLERSVTPATLLGGHIVQGHVDTLARIAAIERGGGEWRVRVAIPAELRRHVASKGSIALDGVSLTVATLDDATASFEVCLIAETLARTTLGVRQAGDELHVEVDCLSKMLERLVAPLRG